MIKKTRRKRTRNILTLAISIVIITYYVIGISQNQFLPAEKKALDRQNIYPDSSSTGVVIKRFNTDGQLDFAMQTNQADFFSAKATSTKTSNMLEDKNQNNDLTKNNQHTQHSQHQQDYLRILDPQITAYEDGKPSQSIKANLAYLTNNGDTTELTGNVLVNDPATAVQLQTQSLTLNTTLQKIFTQSPVTIQTPTSITHAIGLQGNLIDQHWQLLSEVKSIVQPQPN